MEVVSVVTASFAPTLLLTDKVLSLLEARKNIDVIECVKELKRMFSTFKAYLSNQEDGRIGREGCKLTKDFGDRIQDLVLEIEYALDEFMYDTQHHSHTAKIGKKLHVIGHQNHKPVKRLSCNRDKIREKMNSIALLYKGLNVGDVSYGPLQTYTANYCHDATKSFGDEDDMVGFVGRRIGLISQLVEGDRNLLTIQVVGPGGSGKTFLVNNVFKSDGVKKSFPSTAWVSLPRRSLAEELVSEVLNSFCSRSVVEGIMEEAGGIEEKLYRYLEDKKYLIVLDNFSRKQDYDRIAGILPNGLKGSRIIITSRHFDVVDKPDYVHKLHGLDESEALELFCREAFSKSRHARSKSIICPTELMELANKTIQRCDYFPSPITLLAKLLSKKQKTKVEWEKFHDNVCHEIRSNNNSRLFDRLLKPSFVDLSDNLRSCFLYFCMFPEGYTITRGRMIRSWIGEGFIEKIRGKTLEEVAETYLNELIARTLLKVNTPELSTKVKHFKVLRLHHEFIVHEIYGATNNVFAIVDEKNEKLPVEPIRQLCVNHSTVATKLSEIEDPSQVRTLFVFGNREELELECSHLQSILNKIKGTSDQILLENSLLKFKLLKVLDLQNMPMHEFPKNIDDFLLLRCLNLRNTNISVIPRSIKKLLLLEFLDLKYTMVKELPKWMKKLQKLRHLLVSNCDLSSDSKGVDINFRIGALSESLHQVSLLKVKNDKELFKDLGNLKELRKLGLVDLQGESGLELCKAIEKMKNLSTFDVKSRTGEYLDLDHGSQYLPVRIQCLRLKGRLNKLPRWISSLPSLVKIVLKWSKLEINQDPLETLEDLPALLELEMVEYYSGTKLEFKTNKFQRLNKLHIEQFVQLNKVVLQENALPALEKLTLCGCINLPKLPRSLCERKLEELVVYDMSDSFISDVKRKIHDYELVDFTPIGSSSSFYSPRLVSHRYRS